MLNGHIIEAVEALAHPAYQESWDNTGLQVGSRRAECTGVLLCVDVTPAIVEEAHSRGCSLIISHHPLIFKGLKKHMVNHPLKQWLKSAGITRRVTFHSMRHSFATLLAANGVDILTISKMLTHRSVKNTQIYAKVVDERKREAANVISLK